jgi:hypothetical protein
MQKQSFRNHVRFYIPHHFIYYPAILIFLVFSIYLTFATENKLIWAFISALFVLLFYLAFMTRQHYALTLQNRIVRLELRYRYFCLTGKRFEVIEVQLKDEQLFALRFAPDEEILQLIEKILSKNLTDLQIKKAIIHWKGDYERV